LTTEGRPWLSLRLDVFIKVWQVLIIVSVDSIGWIDREEYEEESPPWVEAVAFSIVKVSRILLIFSAVAACLRSPYGVSVLQSEQNIKSLSSFQGQAYTDLSL